MPILTIIDEQRCALEKIEALAQLGLAEPEKARDALVAVLGVVREVQDAVGAILGAQNSGGASVRL